MNERAFGGRVSVDSGEVPGLGRQHGAHRSGEHGSGDRATTAGRSSPRAQQFGEAVGSEEGDRGNAAPSAQGAASSDADVVRRHDDGNRRQRVGCLQRIDGSRERLMSGDTVGSGLKRDRHLK
jgi:hypothetical protein